MPNRFIDNNRLTEEEDAYLDRVCDAFEKAWKTGERPAIQEILAEAPPGGPLRTKLLHELLALEVSYRRQRGELPSLEEYRNLFPNDDIEAAWDEEFLADSAQLPEVPSQSQLSTEGWSPWVHRGWPEAAKWAALPERLGRYRVLATLGAGGFGTVYRAFDETLQREVAIKVAKPHPGCSQKETAYIVSEARIVASLDHPAIVPVYDSGWTESGQFFIVCKFLDGSDLRKKLDRARPGFRETARLIATVAEALHYAHSRRLIHRDVKAGNILLDTNSRPYLTDFGLALFAAQTDSEGAVAGTPAYMSPEQWAGEPLDGRTDIWSLGVVLYEMLASRLPFQGHNKIGLMSQIREGHYRPLGSIDDRIPEALVNACHRCLAREPRDRFSTAEELADQLRQAFASNSRLSSGLPELRSLERSADGLRVHAAFIQIMSDPGKLIGIDFGSYRIHEVLGAGGSGVVLRASDNRLSREVCVKIAYPVRADLSAAMRTLSRCLRGLLALDHPNIVKIYDFGPLHLDDVSSFYLITEFVQGDTLQFWSRKLPQNEEAQWARFRVALAVAETLHAAHQATYLDEVGFEARGILHGDIKPNNIIVRDNERPALNDFMLVDVQKFIDPVVPRAAMARSLVRPENGPFLDPGDFPDSGVFGTPGYMAPEQERQGVVTVRTDVFGLGCTLSRLFFPGVEDLRPLLRVGDQRLRPLCELILAMIDPEPSKRPCDMRAVSERLKQSSQSFAKKKQRGLWHRLRNWFGCLPL
jgi:serine/threonine protein kinase